MLEVPDVQCIRVMVQRGLSVRQIARELHVSRKTVRKYGDPDYMVQAEPRQRIKKAQTPREHPDHQRRRRSRFPPPALSPASPVAGPRCRVSL